jgi:serine/threonine-protein kinase
MGIVEEFIEGSELQQQLGRVAPDEQFLLLLYQMAAGIADIHAVGVVHRDIKPSNMLIDAEGILKIIDFNLARPVDDARTQGFVGTRGYAAPELYVDGQVNFDAKIDVYALAVTAYALLRGPNLPQELLARPPRPSSWLAVGGGFAGLSLPLDMQLVQLLDACLSETPDLRPTARELALRAERVLLRGKHRALFAYQGGRTFELHAAQPKVTLQHPSVGTVSIGYDNLDFRVVAVSGEAWANNMRLTQGALLPGSCVIALGGPERPASQRSGPRRYAGGI